MNDSPEISVCPKCGSEPKFDRYTYHDGNEQRSRVRLRCTGHDFAGRYGTNEREAVTNWNEDVAAEQMRGVAR